MSDTEALTKAIEIAQANGWNTECKYLVTSTGVQVSQQATYSEHPPLVILFNHYFAKALFGEETITSTLDAIKVVAHEEDEPSPVIVADFAWRHHLQEMVIADDPIAYLTNYLETQDE